MKQKHLEKVKEIYSCCYPYGGCVACNRVQDNIAKALTEAKEEGRQEVIEEIEKFIEDNTHKNGYVMTLIELRKKLKEIKK